MLRAMVYRNTKLYFKDKGMFFTSLVTPMILLVLYATFLKNLYAETITESFPKGITVSDKLVDGLSGAQLMSSLLAVCCITVAFCSNFLMVQDKITGARKDLTMAPIPNYLLPVSYFLSSLFSTLIICYAAFAVCLVYIAVVGWYFSAVDILLMLCDITVIVLFGTVLSSVIHSFLSTQGQISAVGTIISAGYGFICGAYMPISSFSDGLQKVLSFFPSTYATVLLRKHTMQSAFKELEDVENMPPQVIDGLKEGIDYEIKFFDHSVSASAMYIYLLSLIAVLLIIYIVLHNLLGKKK